MSLPPSPPPPPPPPPTTPLVGLLDYEELDDAEHQVELAVLAESVHEALMKGYGDAIYNALLANRWGGAHIQAHTH